jgi:hypothetical protein
VNQTITKGDERENINTQMISSFVANFHQMIFTSLRLRRGRYQREVEILYTQIDVYIEKTRQIITWSIVVLTDLTCFFFLQEVEILKTLEKTQMICMYVFQ